MSYIPHGQPYNSHVAGVIQAFESHLRLTMGVKDEPGYRRFILVTEALSAKILHFGQAWACWVTLLRDFDRAYPGNALVFQFVNIPRGSFKMDTRENPTTRELILKIWKEHSQGADRLALWNLQ